MRTTGNAEPSALAFVFERIDLLLSILSSKKTKSKSKSTAATPATSTTPSSSADSPAPAGVEEVKITPVLSAAASKMPDASVFRLFVETALTLTSLPNSSLIHDAGIMAFKAASHLAASFAFKSHEELLKTWRESLASLSVAEGDADANNKLQNVLALSQMVFLLMTEKPFLISQEAVNKILVVSTIDTFDNLTNLLCLCYYRRMCRPAPRPMRCTCCCTLTRTRRSSIPTRASWRQSCIDTRHACDHW